MDCRRPDLSGFTGKIVANLISATWCKTGTKFFSVDFVAYLTTSPNSSRPHDTPSATDNVTHTRSPVV